MYNFSKENDKDFLREASKYLQEEILLLKKENILLRKQKITDDEICKKLSEKLLLMKKRIFDSKQEKKAKRVRHKKKRKKGNLPHNQSQNPNIEDGEDVKLKEEVVNHKLEDENKCPSCGGENSISPMGNCSEESTEVHVTERTYILKRHKRQKYNCKCCKKIITAPGGVKLTPGGEFSIQIATQIACDKYEDHLPLERQRKQMQRAGVIVDVKTLYGQTEHLYNLTYSLLEMIRQDILAEMWVHIDESPFNFYNPKKARGFVWSMSNPRGAYYQFEVTRSGKVAREMLKGYARGNVITDGFSGYSFLDSWKEVKHCFCWAHVRRKFMDAMEFSDDAEKVVDWIDLLYDVEREAESLEDLNFLRAEKSRNIVGEIEDWMESMEGHYLESSTLGKAINYYKNRKKGLHQFLFDKYVPFDNNMAERRQRCPVMGRKNFVHFKSINGADVGVFFYSVIESCKSNGLPARAYINEMAHRAARGETLESPYRYALRISEEIKSRLARELVQLE